MSPSATSNGPPGLSLRPQSPPVSQMNGSEPHENEWYRSYNPDYNIIEKPLHTLRPLRMIIIGAGAAGLEIAYKAHLQLRNVTFQIYEKNNDIGGTWLENRYPGCTCDIPSHSYQFSFARNEDWSKYYSGAEEIWRYLKKFSVDNDLERHVMFGHRINQAKWNDGEGVWEVVGSREDGSQFVDRGEILANCNGPLNSWKYPDIPGIDTFEGKLMHSANWDDKFDLTGKIAAVIGGGSSAVQIIPSIQPTVKKLVPYLRSPVWITAGFGAKYAAPGGVNFEYTEEKKQMFKTDKDEYNQYCRDVEGELNKRFTLMHLKSIDQKLSREYVKNSMIQNLDNDAVLTKALIPDFALGCRRMTPGSDYLQSLRKSNVEVITDSAVQFTKDGIIDASGRETKVDVIICATGFDVTAPSYKIIGRDGKQLRDEFGELPKVFVGPNGPGSHGSILPVLEWHTRYMFKMITHMQRTSIKSMDPSAEAVEDFSVHTHELLKRTAWSSKCRSWFKNGKTHGPVIAIWPGSRLHYFEAVAEPRYEDFKMEYLGNRFSYMGNGYTSAELDSEGNAVWYFDVLQNELGLGAKAFDFIP